jgi:2-hydroxychromene-2-carboxylate isomerase
VPGPIEFWFEFSSPYSYLASTRIDKLAEKHRRPVGWHAFLLGAVFKETGAQPLTSIPLKGAYARRDLERTAALLGVPFKFPQPFPFFSVAPARGFYWLTDSEPGQAKALAKAVYHAVFGEGRVVDKPEIVADIAAGVGVDRQAILAGMADQKVKDRLKAETDQAIAKGVFGAPFVIADGEPFWGHDRFDQLDRWLDTGGW